MNIYLDIETLPTADPAAIAAIAGKIKPPANYKKAETIEAWERDDKPSLIDEAVSKTSFDGLYGRIACIGFAMDDDEPQAVANGSEFQLLLEFFEIISEAASMRHPHGLADRKVKFIGHNLVGFDLPFIKHRAIIHGLKPPAPLLNAMGAKPWDDLVADTMLMWSTDREKRVSMDKLCQAFGIQGKGDFDGSMVAKTWQSDPGKVIEYCKDDVRRTRLIHKRLTFEPLAKQSEAEEQDNPF